MQKDFPIQYPDNHSIKVSFGPGISHASLTSAPAFLHTSVKKYDGFVFFCIWVSPRSPGMIALGCPHYAAGDLGLQQLFLRNYWYISLALSVKPSQYAVGEGDGAQPNRGKAPMQIINPAVRAAAELFTDGAVTPSILADVAAQECLPLYIEGQPPEVSERERQAAVLAMRKQALANCQEDVRLHDLRFRQRDWWETAAMAEWRHEEHARHREWLVEQANAAEIALLAAAIEASR